MRAISILSSVSYRVKFAAFGGSGITTFVTLATYSIITVALIRFDSKVAILPQERLFVQGLLGGEGVT